MNAAGITLTWCKSGIQYVNVHADVDPRVPNSVLDPRDDAVCADLVDVSGSHHFEAAADVVANVTLAAGDWRSDAGVDRGVQNQVLRFVNTGRLRDFCTEA